jgi:glycosyltransferase involved in cell wall biosynthesis
MQEPLVSVHMITYNHAPYIAQAIECVLAQKTDFPFELIIGEDCSTDGTREIVFDYAKRHPDIIRVITSDKNVGMKANSFRTTQAGRGRYIAYCEGDDYWHRDDKLQLQAEYLEAHSDCGLVHSDHDRFFAETGKTIKLFFCATHNVPPPDFNVFFGWGGIYNILTCTVMARKQYIDAIMFDKFIYHTPKHCGATDIPLFIELSMKSKIHYFNESLATYTVLEESASNTNSLKKKAKFVKANLESKLYLAKKYAYAEEEKYFEQRLHRANLWVAFFDKNQQLAREQKRNNLLSLKSWLLYLGATNQLASFLFHVPVSIYIQTKKQMHFFLMKLKSN